jgi:hypothetical protein
VMHVMKNFCMNLLLATWVYMEIQKIQ